MQTEFFSLWKCLLVIWVCSDWELSTRLRTRFSGQAELGMVCVQAGVEVNVALRHFCGLLILRIVALSYTTSWQPTGSVLPAGDQQDIGSPGNVPFSLVTIPTLCTRKRNWWRSHYGPLQPENSPMQGESFQGTKPGSWQLSATQVLQSIQRALDCLDPDVFHTQRSSSCIAHFVMVVCCPKEMY